MSYTAAARRLVLLCVRGAMRVSFESDDQPLEKVEAAESCADSAATGTNLNEFGLRCESEASVERETEK